MASFGRALGVLRTGSQLLRRGTQRITIRNGSGTPTIVPRYRQFPIISKKHILESELLSGAMWFWILWHSWHDPDMVFGHFPWPEASEWTDEELGIPPDDEE
ncbi:NADH dehydrogenase [ubiquinone] 1 beta subcomplex subunit 2, mitochondrial isoform X2 [Gymnodraco acuticeps]|uniref:NADH dehydrogenase [ubiquinone] 1 beta subcomplex subunit 2, mitochondrial n=1 Tax=Gymnodraco acuticeps TaxID=8218 RepID=A0A6P8VMA8_GYMAC|nr:NADH dehydrogenase [ubiquinone] 1 beta subcomplex subunit 2, mitochondrial isoform X2 [Gymnodraco acuticeps]